MVLGANVFLYGLKVCISIWGNARNWILRMCDGTRERGVSTRKNDGEPKGWG